MALVRVDGRSGVSEPVKQQYAVNSPRAQHTHADEVGDANQEVEVHGVEVQYPGALFCSLDGKNLWPTTWRQFTLSVS